METSTLMQELKQNVKKLLDSYKTLKLENKKLKTALEKKSSLNAKISENEQMFKKIISTDYTLRPIFRSNLDLSIDIKQKINNFVKEIDKCIEILSK